MTEHKSLTEAQLAVMAAVPYLQKRTSEGLSYTFAGEADLIRALRTAMLEHGITVSPVEAEAIHQGTIATKTGREMLHIRLALTYRFAHVSGEARDVRVIGEALDTSDKTANKAMTIGLKYALRQFFLIETGDDPDVVAHNREAPNADFVSVAVKRIQACKTPAELDAKVAQFHGTNKDGTPLFTGEQLAELELYATRHRKTL